MLRYLTVANWKSVYSPVEFSLVATSERRHGERLARVGRSRVLPVAALYGANAAGKSILIESLAALRDIVAGGRSRGEALPAVPHRLKGADEPTLFGVEIIVAAPGDESRRRRDWIFYYEVRATRREIRYEFLSRLRSKDEEVLFERSGTDVEFYGDLDEGPAVATVKRFLAPNRTILDFLGSAEEPPAMIGAVRQWFSSELHIVHPSSRFISLPGRIGMDELFVGAMNRGLSAVDTGISRIDLEDIPLRSVLDDEKDIQNVRDRLAVEGGSLMFGDERKKYSLLSLDDAEGLRARQLVAVHDGEPRPDGEPVRGFTLPMSEESDGTARFMNLLPIILQLCEGPSRGVLLVDEFERSMHPLLAQELIRSFLDGVGREDRRQLIFTTHELQFMRVQLLRRDEIWLLDKVSGETRLTRLSEFSGEKVRAGADLLGFYSSGRLGGVPRL